VFYCMKVKHWLMNIFKSNMVHWVIRHQHELSISMWFRITLIDFIVHMTSLLVCTFALFFGACGTHAILGAT
jgi:hypothetical protein